MLDARNVYEVLTLGKAMVQRILDDANEGNDQELSQACHEAMPQIVKLQDLILTSISNQSQQEIEENRQQQTGRIQGRTRTPSAEQIKEINEESGTSVE